MRNRAKWAWLVGSRSKVGVVGGKQEQGGHDWWETGVRWA